MTNDLSLGASADRLARVRARLADHRIPAAVISRPEHVRWLSGWRGSGPAYLLITGEEAALVAPN